MLSLRGGGYLSAAAGSLEISFRRRLSVHDIGGLPSGWNSASDYIYSYDLIKIHIVSISLKKS